MYRNVNWKDHLSRKCYSMFDNWETFIHDAGEELDITALSNVISDHLSKLEERFKFYFPVEEDPRKKNGFVRNPFISIKGDLPVVIENVGARS